MVRVENVFFFFSGYIFFKNRGGHVGGVTKNRTVQGGVATGNREGKLYMQK